jgi:hypothetical protein
LCLFKELNISICKIPIIYYDNQSTLAFAHNLFFMVDLNT